MEQNPFPTRLVLRLATLPIALVITAVIQGGRGCHFPSSSSSSGPPATTEEIEAARAKVQGLDKARREAIGKAKDTIVPRPDLGPCPVRYEPMAAMKRPTIVKPESRSGYDVPKWDPKRPNDLMGNFADDLVAIERIGISYAEEADQKPGPHWFRFESDVRFRPEKSGIDRVLDFTSDPNDFQLVIDREIEGKVGSGETFESGLLIGRLYVWDHQKVGIVCAARIAAANSDELNFHTQPGASGQEKLASLLKSDLREQALAQAKPRLYVAGPPISEDVDSGPHDAGRTDAAGLRVQRDGGKKP